MAIDSKINNNTDDSPSSSDFFVCDDGEEISADLQNNGLEDCTAMAMVVMTPVRAME